MPHAPWTALALAGCLGAAWQEAPPAPHLDAALAVAAWLDHVAIETEHGRTWPEELEGEPRGDLSLYSGAPGVVLFLLEAGHATGRADLIARARAGADELVHRSAEEGALAALPEGLYTGVAGLGTTFLAAWRATGDARYEAAARRVTEALLERARETEHGLTWSESTDVIGGSAGIGLFLLRAARELELPEARTVARRAGDHLVALAVEAEGGSKWAMDASFPRLMPGLSHGTAGVGLFLVRLHDALPDGERDGRHLAAARAGAAYLATIAAEQPGGGELILHHEPGGEDLFYLGWCHGPVGTVRFLAALHEVAADEAAGELADRLVDGLHGSGLPERTPGYWNNVGVCCGSAGIVDFLQGRGAERDLALADRLLADLSARGTRDDDGLRWTHAEHRVRPELLTTQTGLMQGAAGIGLALLRAHAREGRNRSSIVLPDELEPGG
jgi:lantibiotic modifying enzyme